MRKPTIKTWIIAGALSLLPLAVHGAGLGKLTVGSALGESLKAQIELLSVKKEELPSINARLATPEQFKQANLEYGAIHARLKLSVETRADGQSYIRISSSEAVQEPFLAILVELSWSSGRLLREYTFLLDPPGFDVREPLAAAPPPPVVPPVAAISEKPAAATAPVTEAAKPEAAGPAAAPKKPAADGWPVKRGDTLSKVAISVKPEGVSLDQMLVALYRANRKAFMGNNMNRLKTGPILRVPDSSELASIDAKKARKEVRAQAVDWNAYRQKLAAAAASGAPAAAPQQTAAGKITTTVEDKAAAEQPAKEVLKLSKGEAPGDKAAGAKNLQARVHAMEEEVTAKEKALKEASERVALLEKNIKEMQKLLEVKSQTLAEAQKAKPAAQPAPALPAAKPEAPKPEAAKPVEPGKPAEMKPEVTPAELPQPAAAKPEVKPAAKPAPKPVAPPVQAPAPEKNLVDEFLDNPIYIAVIVGTFAVLIGGGFLALRRKKKPATEAEQPGEEMKTIIVSAAAAAAPPQAAAEAPKPAPAQADEVDPIAEAEVYLTYGRDAQAEEILKEAVAKDASRHEVHLKLLEIYGNRKDKAAFEVAARRFQAAGGSGPAWERVINMGIALDPANPLYAGGIAAPGTAVAQDVVIGQAPGKVDFDFDLDLGAPAAAPQAQPAEAAAAKAESMTMDFDITALADEAPKPEAAAPAVPAPASPGSEDIVFDIAVPPPEAPAPTAAPASETAHEAGAISFGDISLDLGETPKPEAAGGDGEGHNAHWQEVATKFDLAKAYQEMGDKDGAREILEEVLREGDARQQEAAKALLASL